MKQEEVIGVIDCTPTWVGVLPIYIACLQDGGKDGKNAATEELYRMAALADKYVKSVEAIQKTDEDNQCGSCEQCGSEDIHYHHTGEDGELDRYMECRECKAIFEESLR